jgi:hypothetical protein
MAVILFIDLLGTRKRWQTGGVPAVTEVFNHFAALVDEAIRPEKKDSLISGSIETDAAMLVFSSAVPALRAAQRMFLAAFRERPIADTPTLWLRGSLVPHRHERFLRRENRRSGQAHNLSTFTYSAAAFDAISVEKAGFKGMRLLVRPTAFDQTDHDALKLGFGGRSFMPLKRLRHIGYPEIVEGELQDFLWMATEDEAEWQELSFHMTMRLRHAAKDADEFAQAAATQVVFHECGAIRQSLIKHDHRAHKKK